MCPLLRTLVSSCSLLVVASVPVSGGAGEAFFSKDGRSVIMGLCNRLTGLVKVEVAGGKITQASLPAELKDECIESVTRGGDGEALFLAKDAVWVWMPGGAAPAKRVCPTAPVAGGTDLFVVTGQGSPLTDALMITGNEKDAGEAAYSIGHFFGRKPGGKSSFKSVFCRRVGDAAAGVFSDDGRFFFVSDGDVWEGSFLVEDDSAEGWLATLVGARIAPLAIANTDGANGGSLHARCIAPAGGWLYVHLSGRHMATLARIPMPAKPLYNNESDDLPTVKAQIDAMSQSLAKMEILVDGLEDVNGFCATEVDGRPRVFYCTRTEAEGKGPAMFLWEGAGEPRIIGYLPEE